MTALDLRTRVALVTGGSRCIGAAIVRSLAVSGADVVINYREQRDAAEALVVAIQRGGGRAAAIAANVADSGAVKDLFARTAQQFGPVDILVNNAGISVPRSIDDLTEADFDRTIEINLKSAFLCMRAALPAMLRKKWGRIVNISSGAARVAGAVGPHYNASKAGMEGLTRGYAARVVKEGITVNAVAPFLVETDMVAGRPDLVSQIPLGRFGTVDEVAQAVMFVVGNGYLTGQTISLSGGMAFS
jgi:3-oxoacyl-[acyl-carrier protein] reductase